MDKSLLNAILKLEKNKSVVEVFKHKNKSYILKKNLKIYTINDVINKQKTLKKLSKNNINVANIIKIIEFNNNIYEVQEFIEGNEYDSKYKYLLYDALGKMHKVSTSIKFPCSTKDYYNFDFECRNIKLTKLLIDFSNIALCHNDLSEFNVLIKNNQIYFIDFDFYKYNYVYCDLVDAFLPRNLELKDFLYHFEDFKKDLLNIVDIYNKYMSINYESFLNCIKLKLISSYFYFMYFTETVTEQKNSIYILNAILKKH